MVDNIAVIISLVAVLVSAFSLGWNIYRDVIVKPRLKVDIAFGQTIVGYNGQPMLLSKVHMPEDGNHVFIILSGVNLGPGKIKCSAIYVQSKNGLYKKKYGVTIHDTMHEVSDKLPLMIDVGESINLVLPIMKGGLLADPDVLKVGIKDSFGRIHWASKKSLKLLKKSYRNTCME